MMRSTLCYVLRPDLNHGPCLVGEAEVEASASNKRMQASSQHRLVQSRFFHQPNSWGAMEI